MTKLFKKLFIKDYQNTENQSVRVAYGIAAGTLGIVANLILFIAKLLVGIFSFSVAVIADAINNLLVCHLDPVSLNDEETNFLKEELDATLKSYSEKLSLHDFRVVSGSTHTNVIFDVVLPFDLHGKDFEIRKLIDDKLATYTKRYYAVIEFDKSFN